MSVSVSWKSLCELRIDNLAVDFIAHFIKLYEF